MQGACDWATGVVGQKLRGMQCSTGVAAALPLWLSCSTDWLVASQLSTQPCCSSRRPQARPLHLRDRPAPRGPRIALPPWRRVLQVGRVGLVNQLAGQAAIYVEGGKTAGTRALPDVRWPPPLLNLCRCGTCDAAAQPALPLLNPCRCGTCTSIRRMADAIVINKANTAPHGSIDKLKDAAEQINPGARVSCAACGCRTVRAGTCWRQAARSGEHNM